MTTNSPGIHHVTGIVRDAQSNVQFYAGVLGLRLVKRTVNQNDRFTRHLFYGDETGTPGTVVSFFPYPAEVDGRPGQPQVESLALVVPPHAVGYWRDRLHSHDVTATETRRFDETVLSFTDPDGTRVELVTGETAADPWSRGPVPEATAIRGIHGVTLHSASVFETASVLETLGFDLVAQDGDRVRYHASGDHAQVVDLVDSDHAFGREGAGTLHHVALRVPDVDALFEWHAYFRERGLTVSRVTDRRYFHSLYVRGPGGILFELATDDPGLVTTEDTKTLGESLSLPPSLEDDRETIEAQLPPLETPPTEEHAE